MGLLFAKEFAKLGGNVVLCDVNKEKIEEVAKEINDNNQGKALAVYCDVRDYNQVVNVRKKTVEAFGRVDIVANFAGRAAEPQEIIDLILFIASEKGQFINGENIMIDGGRNAMKRCK